MSHDRPPVAHEIEAAALAPAIAALSIDGLHAVRRDITTALEEREGRGMPLRHHMMPAQWYQDIDAGIRFAVRVLHAAGLETCQSCEGGAGHAYPEPTVDLVANDAVGLRAVAALSEYGLDVFELSMVWPCRNGMPTDRLWRVTLRRACPERCDEQPTFVSTYMAQTRSP